MLETNEAHLCTFNLTSAIFKFFAFIIPVTKHKKAAKGIFIAAFSSLSHVSVDIRHLSSDVLIRNDFCQINKVAAA